MSTHLTFLCPSDKDTGPAAKAGFLFLGRPGPRLAGLRGVSSFLLANTDVKAPVIRGQAQRVEG